jgi:hypothetical protein
VAARRIHDLAEHRDVIPPPVILRHEDHVLLVHHVT